MTDPSAYVRFVSARRTSWAYEVPVERVAEVVRELKAERERRVIQRAVKRLGLPYWTRCG